MITHLAPLVAPVVPAAASRKGHVEGAGADHPLRKVTRQVAFDPGGWTAERRSKVGALFDDLASEWHTRRRPEHRSTLVDALDRGLAAAPTPASRSVCGEIGSGTGFATGLLAERFALVIAVDLSAAMLARAPHGPGHRVQADAAALPVAGGAVDVAVLVNALLFPDELTRAVGTDGIVVWVNTSGDETPIHLSADDVVAAMPGRWDGVASTAGQGSWCVIWRAPEQT